MHPRLEQTRQACRIHGGWGNLFSATVGVRLSRLPIPERFRPRVYNTLYGKKYDALDEAELEKPLAEYRSINELFTRGVRKELRPLVVNREHHFVVPCDSTVQEIGRIQHDTILTVKDIAYQLSSLAPQTSVSDFHDGHYAILFLSPRDCHRVFSPHDGWLTAMSHVPGYRLLVHPPYQRAEFPVFTHNERLVMELQTLMGRCLVIMVAGWGVGHITHPFDSGLSRHRRTTTRIVYPQPRPISAGDWLATFELGSTVLLVTESNAGMKPSVSAGYKLCYGQSLFQRIQHDGNA